MSRKLRIALGVAALAAAFVVGADYAAWRVTTGRLLAGYQHWRARLAAGGWTIAAAPPRRVGFPLAAQVRLDDLTLTEAAPGGFGWRVARVTFGASLLHPREVSIRPDGAQSVSSPGLGTLSFHAAELTATVPLSRTITTARAAARDLVIATGWGDLTIKTATLDAAWTGRAVHARLEAGPADLPPQRQWGLGPELQQAAMDLTIAGPWGAGAPAVAAAAWRDGGGEVRLEQLVLRWGTLQIGGTGTARLDADLQPDARLSFRVTDPGAALGSLADAGTISRGAAIAAEAVLQLLAAPEQADAPREGPQSSVTLPLRIKQGNLLLGRIPLAVLPPLRW